MDDLCPGDLILSYENSFFSWFVRLMTKSEWSHVGIYEENGTFISSVPFSGVCEKCLKDVNHYAVYRVKGLSKLQADKAVEFCKERLGKGYDFLQIILLGYRLLTDKLDVNAGDPHPDQYVCSELISEAFASVGIHFGKIVDNALPKAFAESDLVTEILVAKKRR